MGNLKAAWIEPKYLRFRLYMLTHRRSNGVVTCLNCPTADSAHKISDEWTGLFDDKENLHGALCPKCSEKLQSQNVRYGLTNVRD